MEAQASRAESERLWAALAHASILVIGIIGPIIVYLVKKDESRWVARQAVQALVYQILVLVVILGVVLVFGVLSTVFLIGTSPASSGAADLGFAVIGIAMGCCWPILFLVAIIYALYGAYSCYKGRDFKYVIIGSRIIGA